MPPINGANFADFFSGFGGRRGRGSCGWLCRRAVGEHRRSVASSDLTMSINVSFDEAFKGTLARQLSRVPSTGEQSLTISASWC